MSDKIDGTANWRFRSIIVPTLVLRTIPNLATILLLGIASAMPVLAEPLRYHGEKTTLEIHTDISGMRHDGSNYGHTAMSLLSKDGAVLQKKQIDDNFACLGYSCAAHAFILNTIGEVVSTPMVVAFEYLPEATKSLVYSKSFTARYVAPSQAIVVSPDLRFIAFVGRKRESSTWRLYVLNTKSDTIRLVGKAPDPPPFSKDELAAVKDMIDPDSSESPSAFWDWEMMHSLESLEPHICKFVSPNILQVSYGRDSYLNRSKKRLVRAWNL